MANVDSRNTHHPASSDGSSESDAPQQIPPGKNRMALESSPYLRMHEDNPVAWYPWGQEAFDRARAENKPIFLSVGYSTCYWCHVMERTVFENLELAALMNDLFINIKVDREERPDVDDIYMTAIQLMRGNGGWPMSVFLTPGLKPFFGATYIPPGPFQQTLEQISAAWHQRPAEILAQADRVRAAIEQSHRGEPPSLALPEQRVLGQAAAQLGQLFDAEYAGFGDAPKFPQPSHLELLLSAHEAGLSEDGLAMVSATLRALARGGIYDQIGRGFHRYSTDREWRVPHFEMMLYDNAQLLHTYARTFAVSSDPQFRRIADEIVQFVQRVLTGESGMFYSALDSETDEEEGRYYVWQASELEALLPAEQWRLFSVVYGLDGPPNFEGQYVLHWPNDIAQTAANLDLPIDVLHERLDPIREQVLAVRSKRKQPLLDDKSIAAWNGLMIEALAYAGRIFDRSDYVTLAARAARTVLGTLRDPQGRLLHVARHGAAKIAAYLDDYAALTLAFVELYRASGSPSWLMEARRTADEMISALWDPAHGGFYYAPATVEHLLVRAKEGHDGALPSGNSLAARALTNLAAETNDQTYAGFAAGTFKSFAAAIHRRPLAHSAMLWALWDYHRLKLPADLPTPTLPLHPETSAAHIRISAQFEYTERPPRIAIDLEIADGWHINANPATLDFLIPTVVRAEHPDGSPLDLNVAYPRASRLTPPGGTEQETLAVYKKSARITATIPGGGSGKDVEIVVRAQACDETGRCLTPSDIRVRVTG